MIFLPISNPPKEGDPHYSYYKNLEDYYCQKDQINLFLDQDGKVNPQRLADRMKVLLTKEPTWNLNYIYPALNASLDKLHQTSIPKVFELPQTKEGEKGEGKEVEESKKQANILERFLGDNKEKIEPADLDLAIANIVNLKLLAGEKEGITELVDSIKDEVEKDKLLDQVVEKLLKQKNLQEALEFTKKIIDEPTRDKRYIDVIGNLVVEGKIEEALGQIDKLDLEYIYQSRIYIDLIIPFYVVNGKINNALDLIDYCSGEDKFFIYNYLFSQLTKQGKLEEVYQIIETKLPESQRLDAYKIGVCQFLLKARQFDKVQEVAKEKLDKEYLNNFYFSDFLPALIKDKQYDKAKELLAKVDDNFHNYEDLREEVELFPLLDNNKMDMAEKWVEENVDDKFKKNNIYLKFVYYLHKEKKYTDMERFARKIVDTDPYYQVFNLIAEDFIQTGEWDKAKKIAEKTLDFPNSNNVEIQIDIEKNIQADKFADAVHHISFIDDENKRLDIYQTTFSKIAKKDLGTAVKLVENDYCRFTNTDKEKIYTDVLIPEFIKNHQFDWALEIAAKVRFHQGEKTRSYFQIYKAKKEFKEKKKKEDTLMEWL